MDVRGMAEAAMEERNDGTKRAADAAAAARPLLNGWWSPLLSVSLVLEGKAKLVFKAQAAKRERGPTHWRRGAAQAAGSTTAAARRARPDRSCGI